jgi:hypothetical protein
MDARSYADRMCANYLTNLLFCQPLFPDSLSLIRESDAPVDRGGLTQSYYALMLRWYFDLPWLTRAAPRGEATAYATSWRRTHRRYPRAGQVPSQSASLRHVSATS